MRPEPPLEIQPVRPPVAWEDDSESSSAVNEVLGRTPPWILRSGISILAWIVALLLLLSWLIHYPDAVSGKITITGTNPSVAIIARQSGRLERLNVTEGQQVGKGHLLGVINNPADTTRMFRLREELRKLEPFLADTAAFKTIDLSGEGQLGGVQTAYSDFHGRYRQYEALLHDDFSDKAVASLLRQLQRKHMEYTQIQQQATAARREKELAQENFERMQLLHANKSISTAELQTQERVLLEQQRTLSAVDRTLLEQETAAAEVEKQVRELNHKRADELRIAASELAESLKKLLAGIDIWESDFVLRAPTNGMVAFYDFWADQQFVTLGKAVFIIAPETTVLLGRMPVAQGGKIKTGQIVRIKLDDFPSKEFGLVSGTVKSVSLVAQQGQQLVSVDLQFPLVSSYRRTIAFKQEMTGDALVITDDRRLIERLFSEIRRAFAQSAR